MASKISSSELWYALATLYGEHKPDAPRDVALHDKNRETWNRLSAHVLTKEQRQYLINEDRVQENELRRYNEYELREIRQLFLIRLRTEIPEQLPEFDDGIDFTRLNASTRISMEGFLFAKATDFTNTQSVSSICFKDATFLAPTQFTHLSPANHCDFSGALFMDKSEFVGCNFGSTADFSMSTFKGESRFKLSTFSSDAIFKNVSFLSAANFKQTKFLQSADFREATFHSRINFDGTKFAGTTLYTKAKFLGSPPSFYGSELHQDTDWLDITWPDQKDLDRDGANSYVRAYERLKLEMDSLRKIDDELFFLAQELQCKAVRDGGAKGCLILSYGLFSDYGRSIWRPLFCMFLVWLTGFLSTYLLCTLTTGRAAAISASNLVGFFGFNRAYIESDVLQTLPEWTKILFASQTLLAAPLLFLTLLALRNRFRIK